MSTPSTSEVPVAPPAGAAVAGPAVASVSPSGDFFAGFYRPDEYLRERPRGVRPDAVLEHLRTLVAFGDRPEDPDTDALRDALTALGPIVDWDRLGPLTPAHVRRAAEVLQPRPRPEWLVGHLADETTNAEGERVFVVQAVVRAEDVYKIIDSGEFGEFSRLRGRDLRRAFADQEVFVEIESEEDVREAVSEAGNGE